MEKSHILRLVARQDQSTTTTSSSATPSTTSSSTSTSTSSATSSTSTSTSTDSTTTPTSTSTTSTSSSSSSDTSSTSTQTSTSSSSSSTTSSTTSVPPQTSSLISTDESGHTQTIVTVITASQSSTRGIAPSSTSSSDNNNSSFFHNTGAVAGTFAAVGIVALVIIFIVGTTFVRRRRAKAFDREIAEAAREARATGTTGIGEYLDEPGAKEYGSGYGGFGGGGYLGPGGGGGGGGGGYPASMSEADSHGTYGAYGQAPMGHSSDGGEMYQMRDMGNTGPSPGGFFDHNAAYAAGAAGLGAGAAGIGVARARSHHGQHPANTNQDSNDPNGYYSHPNSAGSPPPNLERNNSQYTGTTNYNSHPSSFAAALADGGGGAGPYPAFLAPGGMHHAMTQGGVSQSVLDAAGLGAAAGGGGGGGSGTPSPPSSHPGSPPVSSGTPPAPAPEKESYAAHYARPIGSSPKQSTEGNGGDDAYGGIGGLAYDESERGHGADKAQASRTSSDSANDLPNPFGRAIESESEGEESEEGGAKKVLRVANE